MHRRIKASFLWQHLPMLVILYSALTLLHLHCRTLLPAPRQMAYTVIFPLFWIAWLVWKSCRDAGRTPVASMVCVVGSCILLPAAALLIPPVTPLQSMVTLKRCFEVAQAVLFVVMAAHCLSVRGPWMFLLFFGAGTLYGVSLENGGIMMEFFREDGYIVYLRPWFPGPVFTALGWPIVFSVAAYCAERLAAPGASTGKKVALATAAALSLDLQLDPTATFCGWWEWHETLPAFHHGVPLINYLSWICALVPFAWHYFHLQAGSRSEKDRAKLMLASVPAYLVVSAVLVLAGTLIFCGPGSASMALFIKAITETFRGIGAYLGWA